MNQDANLPPNNIKPTKLNEANVTAVTIAKKDEYLAATNSLAPRRLPDLTAAANPTDNGNIKVTVVTCMAMAWEAIVSSPRLLSRRPEPLKRPNSTNMQAPIGKPNLKISEIFSRFGFSYSENKFAD